MNILDDLKKIKRQDPGHVLASADLFGEQLKQAWNEFKKVKLPASFKGVDKIVVNGMGGSALGTHVLQSVFFADLKIPVELINGYQVPGSVNHKTLYIMSSYSGTTEEPISTYLEVKRRGAKLFAIASGGILAKWVNQGKVAGFVYEPKFNPSGQPRMSLGYSFGAQLGLLKKMGLINLSDADIASYLKQIDGFKNKFGADIPAQSNLAKQLALQLKGRTPVLIAAEFLAGNAHVFSNQLNENAKTFVSYFLLPELNHHLIEGLRFPKSNPSNLSFVFLESKLLSPRVIARYGITKKIVAKHRLKVESYAAKATTRLGQVFEVLVFGSYASFYLAILNGLNPSLIPWVDFLKSELKKIK